MTADTPTPDPDGSPEPGLLGEDRIRALLADLESPPIPDAVRISVMAAITREARQRRAEPTGTRTAAGRRRRVWGPRRIIQISAVAAAMVVVAAVAIPAIQSSDSDTTFATGVPCAVDAHPENDMSVVMRASGVSYDSGHLADQANSMLEQPSELCGESPGSSREPGMAADRLWLEQAVAPPSGGSGAAATVPDSDPVAGTQPSGSPGQVAAVTGEPREVAPGLLAAVEPQVKSCVVSAVPGRRISAVDVAGFDGRPAVVVVADRPDEVFVIRCSVEPPQVMAQVPIS